MGIHWGTASRVRGPRELALWRERFACDGQVGVGGHAVNYVCRAPRPDGDAYASCTPYRSGRPLGPPTSPTGRARKLLDDRPSIRAREGGAGGLPLCSARASESRCVLRPRMPTPPLGSYWVHLMSLKHHLFHTISSVE